jgi:hypothetical protein
MGMDLKDTSEHNKSKNLRKPLENPEVIQDEDIELQKSPELSTTGGPTQNPEVDASISDS